MILYTAGYQGFTIDQFIEEMKVNGIITVVDVRFRSLSRTKGFGTLSLFKELYQCGIEYIQMPGLGVPDYVRKLYGRKKDNSDILKWFRSNLDEFDGEIQSLKGVLEAQEDKVDFCGNAIALLCFEEDPATCHRSVLAQRLQELIPGLEVVHLRRENV